MHAVYKEFSKVAIICTEESGCQIRMPRRALSTLRAEIREGGPAEASMELSESVAASAGVVSTGDASLVGSLMWNLRGFERKLIRMQLDKFFGVESGKLFCARESVEVGDGVAAIACFVSSSPPWRVFGLFGIRRGISTRRMLSLAVERRKIYI